MAKTPTALVTSMPLTAEARESWLHDMFSELLPHYGELLVPRDSFYDGPSSHKRAQHVLKNLCAWLGIKPGYVGLIFESDPEEDSGGRYNIYLESAVVRDDFLLGATLAMALTRYLLEEKKQIHLPADEQRLLIGTASILFGLGLVIANGLHHEDHDAQLLGSLSASQYAAMLHGFFRQRRIAMRMYQAYLPPWTAQLLDVPKPARLGRIAAEAYHRQRHGRYQTIGVIWIIILVLGLGGYVLFQRAQSESPETRQKHEQLELLQYVHNECVKTYEYNRRFVDTSDLQAERNMNAEAARCQSIGNELKNAQFEYQKLLRR